MKTWGNLHLKLFGGAKSVTKTEQIFHWYQSDGMIVPITHLAVKKKTH